MNVELVRDLAPLREGQTRALYRRGDEFIVVSTVADVKAGLDEASRAIIDLGGLMGAMTGRSFATDGEETMAFEADAWGEVTDWCEIAASRGRDSRDAVLQQLATGSRRNEAS